MTNHIESLKKRLNYSLLQFVDADSASISIGAVLAFYGFHSDLTSLQDVCATSKQFPSVEALLRAVEHFNLEAIDQRLAEDHRNTNHHNELSQIPSLILEESGRVVACFDSYNNNLVIYDPAQGVKEIPRDQLQTKWQVYLRPNQHFQCSASKPSPWNNLFELCMPVKNSLIILVVISIVQAIPTLVIAGGSAQFINSFIDEERFSFGLPIIWIISIALIVAFVLRGIRFLILRRCEAVLTYQMADDIYQNILSQSQEFYDRRISSELSGRLLFPWYMPYTVFNSLIASALQLLTSLIVLFSAALISVPLFLLLSSGFFAAIYANYFVTAKSITPQNISTKESMDAYGVGITGLANATEIIGQELNAEFIRDWHKHFLVIVQKNQLLGRLKILRRVTISNSIFAIKALLLGVGGLLIMRGQVSLGTLIAFLFIEQTVASSMFAIPNLSQSWQLINAQLRLYDDLVVRQKQSAESLPKLIANNEAESTYRPNRIHFSDVTRSVSLSEEPILKNISFELMHGQSLSLFSKSNSEVNEFIHLLTGLTTPDSGIITGVTRAEQLLGVDQIRQAGSQLGFIPKSPMVVAGTFSDNITLYEDSFEQSQIVAAAQHAGLHNYITSFDRGYNHRLITKDNLLSGHLLIKLEIARAYLKGVDLFVFENISSQLNEDEARVLIASLLKENRSIVFYSDIPSVLKISDKFALLHEGELVFYGDTALGLETYDLSQFIYSS